MPADENPTLDPLRSWTVGGQHVAFDASALVRKLDTDGCRLLQFLAEHAANRPIGPNVMSAIMDIDAPAIEMIVGRVNILADTLGYVPLILGSDQGFHLQAGAAPVVIQGVLDAKS